MVLNLRQKLSAIQTPTEIINQLNPPEAEKILPDRFSDFSSILAAREDIRHLRLLPVKHNQMREYYRSVKSELLSSVEELLGAKDIVIAPNQFPYFLPPDLDQKIIWVRDEVDDQKLLDFITNYVSMTRLDPDRIIMFERPRHIKTPLVRGSFPAVRHLHFWSEVLN